MAKIKPILVFFLFFIFFKPSGLKSEQISFGLNVKNRFDNRMEKIEQYLRNGNKKEVCNESIYLSSLVKNNINNLKNIEPNYDWIEIRKTLLSVSKKYCIK